jgi:hypothetical protein
MEPASASLPDSVLESEPDSLLESLESLLESVPPLLESVPPLLESVPPLLESVPPLLESVPPLLESVPPLLESFPKVPSNDPLLDPLLSALPLPSVVASLPVFGSVLLEVSPEQLAIVAQAIIVLLHRPIAQREDLPWSFDIRHLRVS